MSPPEKAAATPFRVIEGGAGRLSMLGRADGPALTRLEITRAEIVDRVAERLFSIERPVRWPEAPDWVGLKAAAATHQPLPGHIAVHYISLARAAVEAMKPDEVGCDEDVAVEVANAVAPSDPVAVLLTVEAWIDEVLR